MERKKKENGWYSAFWKTSKNTAPSFGPKLASLINEMYETRKSDGDFSIKCDGVKIPCHKIILASSSPVFKAMIRSKMKESKQGEMEVDSFSLNTVTQMIQFFYTKTISQDKNIEDILGNVDYFELLRAADFFDVPLLKKVCEHSLTMKMTRDTVLETYKTAKLYNAENLMKESRRMIVKCKAEIMSGEGWKQKLKELNDPDIMIEMLENGYPTNKKHQYFYPFEAEQQRYRSGMEQHVPVSNLTHAALCKDIEKDMLFNMASLYNDEDTADLCCVMDQEKIHVHKTFLKLYSEPFFNKMLKNNQIDKIEKDVLKFMYTGKIEDYAMTANELIEMAHTFKFPLLKAYCEGTLIATLTVENVLERFIIASRTDSSELRKKTLELMKRENKNIMKTENWRQLVKDNVDIVFELIMEGWSQ